MNSCIRFGGRVVDGRGLTIYQSLVVFGSTMLRLTITGTPRSCLGALVEKVGDCSVASFVKEWSTRFELVWICRMCKLVVTLWSIGRQCYRETRRCNLRVRIQLSLSSPGLISMLGVAQGDEITHDGR